MKALEFHRNIPRFAAARLADSLMQRDINSITNVRIIAKETTVTTKTASTII